MPMNTANMNITETEWDEVRRAFASSIMVNTSISSLAQNLDGPDWPIQDREETPAVYIDLPLSEAHELLATKGLAPEHIDFLASILKDTLAFDNPFGEMVAQNEVASTRDNQLLKNLAKLGIPENFPLALIPLDPDTRAFCEHENLATLGALAVFAQSMSQNVIVGGDFRKLLNSLSHIDEPGVAEVLPFRPGATGLHLVEALAQATRTSHPAGHAALAVDWFKDDLAALKVSSSVYDAFAREFSVLGNPDLEIRAADLLQPYLHVPRRPQNHVATFFRGVGRMFGS
jgi:hypothetical protein